jgi:hypothetical protein
VRRRQRAYSPGSRYSALAMWLLVTVFLCSVFLIDLAISAAAKFQHGF